jgi:hypothetical protein
MDAATRSLKPVEMAVLYLHVKEPDLAFSLGAVEKRMGPKGMRSPCAEAQSYLIDQGLLAPGISLNGQIMAARYTATPAGVDFLGRSLRSTLELLEADIARAKLSSPKEEVQRLEHLRELMPPIEMATSSVQEAADDEDDADEEVRTKGPALGAKAPKGAPTERKSEKPVRTVGAALKGRRGGAPNKPPPRCAAV